MIWITKLSISLFLMILLIWFGVLNSHNVNFYLIPIFFNYDNFYFLNIPLYLIIIFSILFGFVFGCILENKRSNKIRKSLKLKSIELKKSDSELMDLKKKINSNNDEILSLLE